MVAVFSIFATLSLLDFKQMGVGLAVAVLIDATLIRGVLLPATMTLLGERNWWLPRSLRLAAADRARGRGGAPPRADRRSDSRASGARHLAGAGRSGGAIPVRADASPGLCSSSGCSGATRWWVARLSSATIDRALERLDTGAQGCLTVEGEPGIGKTRMLDGAAPARRANGGYLVLRGVASEFETYVPVRRHRRCLRRLPGLAGRRHRGRLARRAAARARRSLPLAPRCRRRHRRRAAATSATARIARSADLVERLAADATAGGDPGRRALGGRRLARADPGPAAPPRRRPALLALGFRPGQAPPRLEAALAAPGGRTSRPRAAEPRGGGRAARRRGRRHGSWTRSTSRAGQPVLPGAALPEPAAAGGRSAPGEEGGVPAGIAASVAEELAALPADARRCSRRRRSPAIRSNPTSPPRSPGSTTTTGLAALDELLAVDLVRPTELPRRFAFRHPLVAAGGLRGAPGRRPDRRASRAGGRGLAARGAPATARAHHVEHAARQGGCEAIALLHRGGRGEREPRACRRGALVRCGAATAAGSRRRRNRWRYAASSPRRCAPAASSSRCRERPARGDRADRRRRRSDSDRADDALRRRRALAGTEGKAPPAPRPCPGKAARATRRGGRHAARSSSRSTACSTGIFDRAIESGEAALASARAARVAGVDRSGRGRALPRRGGSGADRERPASPRRGASRSSTTCRDEELGGASGGSLPASAGPRTTSSTSTRRSRTSTG